MQGVHLKRIKLWQYGVMCLLSCVLVLGVGDRLKLMPASAIAQPAPRVAEFSAAESPEQLVQQGVELYELGEFQSAIERWETALAHYERIEDTPKVAIVLENLARTYQQTGRVEQAVTAWGRAIALYNQLNDLQQVGRLLTEQAQSYSRLGQHRQAVALLCGELGSRPCVSGSALDIAQQVGDQATQVAALGSLGEAYRLMGSFEEAQESFQAGLELVRTLGETTYEASLLSSLGNTLINQAQEQYRRAVSADQAGDLQVADELWQSGKSYDQQALKQFQAGLDLVRPQGAPSTELRLLLSMVRPAYRIGEAAVASAAYADAQNLLTQLPDSQEKVYAAIDLATLSHPIPVSTDMRESQSQSGARCMTSSPNPQAVSLLQTAISTAQRIGDRRSESFALGALGHGYECSQDYAEALQRTQDARWAAEQDLRSNDSLYLWEWQTGRILKAQGKDKEAIALYEQAIRTLEGIRSDLLIANQDAQFNFRDSVDPLYRELIELRLGLEPAPVGQGAGFASKDNVDAVLRQLDSLKLAELQNYFGNDCVIAALNEDPVGITEADATAAVFSSIVLDSRTAIVVRLPNGQQLIHWINTDSSTLRNAINRYRVSLERYFEAFDPQEATAVYDWIIEPFADALNTAQVKTLVFVQDDIFRSVPMAALYDEANQQFLIEQYAIATTPSLTLTEPQAPDRDDLRALALGLSEEVTVDGRLFQALENVDRETLTVETRLPGSQRLLNQEFTYERLQQELDQNIYPIVHIATHGEFGTEPEDTFLVTGDGQKLTITQLDNLFRRTQSGQQVELLSLTACQTAVGDNRAALGLAGVAVQSGAKSAIASLWFIDDQATAEIMEQFYSNWLEQSTVSKAEALRAAQVSVIQSGGEAAHPAYWAPFVLIGNWL